MLAGYLGASRWILMRDLAVVLTVACSFAALISAHISIVYGLVKTGFGWKSLLALVVAPLALIWAIRERMRARAVLWGVSAVVYAVGIVASLS